MQRESSILIRSGSSQRTQTSVDTAPAGISLKTRAQLAESFLSPLLFTSDGDLNKRRANTIQLQARLSKSVTFFLNIYKESSCESETRETVEVDSGRANT